MLFMVWALNIVTNSHKPEDVGLLSGLHYGALVGIFLSMMIMGINYFTSAGR